MNNRLIKYSFFLFLIITLSSCGTILKSRKNFVVESSQKNATIFLDDEKIPSHGSVSPSEYKGSIQARSEREGYKTEYDALIESRVSIAYLLGILTYTFWLDGSPTQYDPYYQIQHRYPINERKEDQRFINVSKVGIKLNSEDFNLKRLSYNRYLRLKKSDDLDKVRNSNSRIRNIKENFNYDNSVYSSLINKELVKHGYIDTTGTFLTSRMNTLNLEAELVKVDMFMVGINGVEYFAEAQTEINWVLKDGIDNELLSITTDANSGKFLFTYKAMSTNISYVLLAANIKTRDVNEAIENALTDAVLSNIYDFLQEDKIQEILNDKIEKEKIDKSTIPKPTSLVSTLEEAVDACVAVKVDEGHGSGFFINNEGYLLTNHHVIKDSKKTTVLYKGESYPATVIKSAKLADIALLKIDFKNQFAFTIPDERSAKIGQDVFAIGTPRSLDLQSTVSKGIISGFREVNEDQTLLQTDVSINFGNSGGPIVSKEGSLLGIVNSKLAGFAIEGISFGLMAEQINNNLNIVFE